MDKKSRKRGRNAVLKSQYKQKDKQKGKKKSRRKKEKEVKHETRLQFRGKYKNISYESLLELAALLLFESSGLSFRNYDLDPIPYWHPTKKKYSNYFPDFIVNDFLIIEVKWLGFLLRKKGKEILSKQAALSDFCEKNQKFACLFMSDKMIEKKYVRMARQTHKNLTKERGSANGGWESEI
jgi:archaellum component FlaD/FlaE